MTRDFSDQATELEGIDAVLLTHEQLVDAVAGICARAAPAYDGLQLSIPPPRS